MPASHHLAVMKNTFVLRFVVVSLLFLFVQQPWSPFCAAGSAACPALSLSPAHGCHAACPQGLLPAAWVPASVPWGHVDPGEMGHH